VDYSFDQRPGAGQGGYRRGDRVRHPSLGDGVVLACEGPGRDAKVTVAFEEAGEKRVLARFLVPGG
jgi:DNA helicase-2/ATP-dependent DNA helicase PcrA